MKYRNPIVDETAFIAEGVKIIGCVTIKKEASVWYNSVIRGDIQDTEIIIGERTNIQDGTIIHNETGMPSTVIGNDVTVGHNCIIHACTIEDGCLIGMGAIILSGAHIKKGTTIGAGAVVKENCTIGPNTLAVGIPAKEIKQLPDTNYEKIVKHSKKYVEQAKQHKNNKYGIYK